MKKRDYELRALIFFLPTWQFALECLAAVYPAVPLQYRGVRRLEPALLTEVLLRRRVDDHVRRQGVLPLETVGTDS